MALNHVAGIVDLYGGLRVVSTKNKSDFFRHHRLPGERVFIVPGLRVPEPVPWDDIPWMMNCVVNHIAQWIAMQNDPDLIERGAIGAYRKRVADGQQKSLHVTVADAASIPN